MAGTEIYGPDWLKDTNDAVCIPTVFCEPASLCAWGGIVLTPLDFTPLCDGRPRQQSSQQALAFPAVAFVRSRSRLQEYG